MFKKAASVAFKGDNKIRGKETKSLRDAVAAQLGGDPAAAALLPAKAEVSVRKAGGGSNSLFVFVDGVCFFVQPDGKAALGISELIPTLPALWSVASVTEMLPCVRIQRPVARFIFGGANIMAPGIHSVLPADVSDKLPKEGELVAVRAVGNPSACAVGRMLRIPAAQLGSSGTKGEAVEVIHYFGDALWEASGSPRPQGFVGTEIQETAPEDAAGAPLDGAAPAGEAGAAAGGAEAPEPAEDAGVTDGDEATEGAASPEAMTRALEECFLQAAKTRIKDKDLPMAGNALYAQHMRPCRRAGTNIDVKSSGCKKLVTFLSRLEDSGWLALKKGSADPVVTRILRDHPDIREWRPWPRGETAEASEATEDSGGTGSGAGASFQVESVWRATKLAPLVDALGDKCEAAKEKDACWLKPELQHELKRYADSRNLWAPNNKKRINPDGLLQGLLGKGGAEHGSFSLEALAESILSTLPACHRVTAPQGGAAGGFKISVRPGKPPLVQVRTDQRRGHNVTLVHGLEGYGVDQEAFAACLQKALASSTTVEEAAPGQQAGVMVQGLWDVAVGEWLGKIGIPSESIQQQAKKGLQQKKVKQASNIVKH